MSAEHKFRREVVKLLSGLGAFAVENTAMDGTPDVATIIGWLELKYRASWPSNRLSNVAIGLRTSQRVWISRWIRHGGHAWVLARIGAEVLLWQGAWAAANLDSVDRATLVKHAVARWEAMPSAGKLTQALLGSIVRN